MVALKTERQVFLWHVAPHAIPSETPVSVKLTSIFAILQSAYDEKRAFVYLRSDGRVAGDGDEKDVKNCIYIAQMKPSSDGHAMVLLINRGDPDAANPSFLDPQANDVENVSPGEGKVQGWSAHLTIAIKPRADGRHRACFERMSNVSGTLVQRYLEAILDAATVGDEEFSYKKLIKKGKRYVEELRPYKIRLGVNKVPSEKILEDIKNSELSGIKLIRKKSDYTGPASPNLINSVTETLSIKTKKMDESIVGEFVRKVQNWGRDEGYEEIQFEVSNLPGGGSASPRFSLDIADAMDTLYSRSLQITGFPYFLETCYKDVDPEIADKMLSLLKDESHWR